MKFFNSRVNSEVWAVADGWIFLTSEFVTAAQADAAEVFEDFGGCQGA